MCFVHTIPTPVCWPGTRHATLAPHNYSNVWTVRTAHTSVDGVVGQCSPLQHHASAFAVAVADITITGLSGHPFQFALSCLQGSASCHERCTSYTCLFSQYQVTGRYLFCLSCCLRGCLLEAPCNSNLPGSRLQSAPPSVQPGCPAAPCSLPLRAGNRARQRLPA